MKPNSSCVHQNKVTSSSYSHIPPHQFKRKKIYREGAIFDGQHTPQCYIFRVQTLYSQVNDFCDVSTTITIILNK